MAGQKRLITTADLWRAQDDWYLRRVLAGLYHALRQSEASPISGWERRRLKARVRAVRSELKRRKLIGKVDAPLSLKDNASDRLEKP